MKSETHGFSNEVTADKSLIALTVRRTLDLVGHSMPILAARVDLCQTKPPTLFTGW